MPTMPRSSKKRPSFEPIIINEDQGLVFDTEDDLYAHFDRGIQILEKEYARLRRESDLPEDDFRRYDRHLDHTLDDPDEVWEDSGILHGDRVYIYLRHFDDEISHVAVCFLTGAVPSFVYLHFPTRDDDLVEKYRRGELVFERLGDNVAMGALEGDALHENDELAEGLYRAMLSLRAEKDVPEEEFVTYADYREETLEDADEIWRSGDQLGNVLVSFIKEYTEDEEFTYVVVTVEDEPSGSHALLFSFPTRDRGLADRYRHGENLQAEEVTQESSH